MRGQSKLAVIVVNEYKNLFERKITWFEAIEFIKSKFELKNRTVVRYLYDARVKKWNRCGCGELFISKNANKEVCPDCEDTHSIPVAKSNVRKKYFANKSRVNLPYKPYPKGYYQPIDNVLIF